MNNIKFAVAGIIWLIITYFAIGYLIDNNCYIQTREQVWIHDPIAMTDYPPEFGQAEFVQRKLNESIREVGFLSDSAIQKAINDKGLYDCVVLKADTSYYEVLCSRYVATPDTIYSVVYRPVIIKTVSH